MSQADLDAERNAVTTAKRASDALKHEARQSKRRRILENGPGHVYVSLRPVWDCRSIPGRTYDPSNPLAHIEQGARCRVDLEVKRYWLR